jgi:hypothetical protein
MFKIISALTVISAFVFFTSGCALIGTAISAGIGYGIYQATNK